MRPLFTGDTPNGDEACQENPGVVSPIAGPEGAARRRRKPAREGKLTEYQVADLWHAVTGCSDPGEGWWTRERFQALGTIIAAWKGAPPCSLPEVITHVVQRWPDFRQFLLQKCSVWPHPGMEPELAVLAKEVDWAINWFLQERHQAEVRAAEYKAALEAAGRDQLISMAACHRVAERPRYRAPAGAPTAVPAYTSNAAHTGATVRSADVRPQILCRGLHPGPQFVAEEAPAARQV